MSNDERDKAGGAQEWLDHAERDLRAAQTLFTGGDYTWMLVLCQQAIEKFLKAAIIARTEEEPPRIHNLPRLAELAGFDPGEKQMMLMREIGMAYIESRYPVAGLEVPDLTEE